MNFCCWSLNYPCHCLTDWGRNLFSAQHTSHSSQRVKYSDCRHQCASGWPKHWWQGLSWWDTNEECLPTCWELWETRESLSNKVPLESEVCTDQWHILPEIWIKPGKLKLEEETHNTSDMSKGGWKHSILRPSEVVYFSGGNSADIDWSWGCQQIQPWLTL